MKNEEVNKIIAEYMGCYWNENDSEYNDAITGVPISCYTNSLDSLVLVHEKILGVGICEMFEYGKTNQGLYSAWFEYQMEDYIQVYYSESDTIQEAAAHATAKAIMALGDDNEK